MIDNPMEYSANLPHPTPDAIEAYAMASVRDRLDPDSADVIRLEEHFLWCTSCLDSVEAEEAAALLIIDELDALNSRSKAPAKPKVLHAGQDFRY